jgi:hypothetical protein
MTVPSHMLKVFELMKADIEARRRQAETGVPPGEFFPIVPTDAIRGYEREFREYLGLPPIEDERHTEPAQTPEVQDKTVALKRSVPIGGDVSNSVIIVGDGNVVGDSSSSRASQGTSVTPAEGAPHPTESKRNTPAIRDLLNAAFSDEELTTFCFDHFRPVYDDFASGMGKGQKVQRLLDYCVRQEQVERLLAAVRKANPEKYQRFGEQLAG